MTSFWIHMGLFISDFLISSGPRRWVSFSHGAATYPVPKTTDGTHATTQRVLRCDDMMLQLEFIKRGQSWEIRPIGPRGPWYLKKKTHFPWCVFPQHEIMWQTPRLFLASLLLLQRFFVGCFGLWGRKHAKKSSSSTNLMMSKFQANRLK